MTDRELLENQAKELGVKVVDGISDADLLKALEAAKARLDLEKRATELGVEFAANIGDKKLADRIKEAEEAAAGSAGEDGPDATDEPEAGFTVQCAVAGGRRRAGRRWDGGLTHVPAEEMTDEMLSELMGDPLLQVTVP